ncbi:MAG: amidohydrolase family protein, partial [Emcibacteraceae bacterium]|nr:amidohydrolase family protein [Emcibacteraceae bacterium]
MLNNKVLLAHANGVTLDEMHMIKPLGVSLCNTPESEAPYGEMPSFGNGEAAGLDISIGADSVIFNGGDMFSAMRMTLQFTRYGQAPAWDNDKSSHITHPMSILKAATIDGARAMGIDGKVGSLEKGKQADIIMIDTNGPHFQPMT